jgi:ABC-type antimicrobial peptide transport system permease subunit
VGEQLRAVAAGLAVGAVATAWVVPIVGARLYGVGVYDIGVWLPAVAVMLATATLSAWLPAARASRIDPVATLREG